MLKNLILSLGLSLTLFATGARAEDKNGLKNESEAGIVITGGNAQTSTMSLKQTSTLVEDLNTYKFTANYLRTSTAGNETALQWGLGVRYERGLSDSFSLFLGQLLESNIYQNIQQRYATDFGGKYIWRDLETFKWNSELGYRFARENYVTAKPDAFKNINFIRLYNEVQYFFSKTVSTKWWFEFLPNITDSDAYQFNTELSLTAALSDVFSVKSGYLIKYNNKPEGGVLKTDSTFTTALVAKF
ncbi:MAG: DUF481 domain-containing protein [Bdellovibrionales bacterium]|nr:DUF481 domain-containing protein [Bdellovibrionales bacterium]